MTLEEWESLEPDDLIEYKISLNRKDRYTFILKEKDYNVKVGQGKIKFTWIPENPHEGFERLYTIDLFNILERKPIKLLSRFTILEDE